MKIKKNWNYQKDKILNYKKLFKNKMNIFKMQDKDIRKPNNYRNRMIK